MVSPQVSIVVPCYNEVGNVGLLVTAVEKVFAQTQSALPWEIIFVDDNSPDGTSDAVRDLAAQDPRVRGIKRIGRRGLSSAVIEGALSSSAPVIAVMDGDLQHDEACLPEMVISILKGKCDLAVASRHVEGGANDGLANRWRCLLSNGGIWIAQKLLSVSLSDPMSGFFAVRRSCFEARAPYLTGEGFKILLDIVLARPEALAVREFPMVFRDRKYGESKLGSRVMFSFVRMILAKYVERYYTLISCSLLVSMFSGMIFCFVYKNILFKKENKK